AGKQRQRHGEAERLGDRAQRAPNKEGPERGGTERAWFETAVHADDSRRTTTGKHGEHVMKAKLLATVAAGLLAASTTLVWAENSTSDRTPGHEMQKKGSKGEPGA